MHLRVHAVQLLQMKNKETPLCEPAQRTDAYVTGEQKGVDEVIRCLGVFNQAERRRWNSKKHYSHSSRRNTCT